MSHLVLFLSCFVTVFALGIQSLNVNGGHYTAAAVTSLLIGLGHVALYRYMPGADIFQILAYLAGGPLGITASMFVHKRTIGKRKAPAPPYPIPPAPLVNPIPQPHDFKKSPAPPPSRHGRPPYDPPPIM